MSTATKQDTKTQLLQVGMEMMLERGYTNTGIQEVLNALNVPKGSFYHYFDSKESFAVEIIDYFDREYAQQLMRVLKNPQESPVQRLKTYCDTYRDMLVAQGCRKGCLIGNLSQEMSDQSEVLRKKLTEILRNRREILAACIEEGQQIGEIKSRRSALELADFFFAAWGRAVMSAKTVKNIDPLNTFIDVMFADVLKD